MDRREFIETIGVGLVTAAIPSEVLALPSNEGGVNGPIKLEAVGDKVCFRGHLMTVDRVNSNGRIYPRQVVEKALRKVQPLVENGSFAVGFEQDKVTVSLANMCGFVKKFEFDGDHLFAEGELIRTPLQEIIKSTPMQIRPVGLGSAIVENDESFIIGNYELVSLSVIPKGCIW